MPKPIKPFLLVVSIGLCLLAGGIGSIATAPSIPTWYAGLNKPFFNPPAWVFGPVWTLLYVLMGLSLYLVWVSPPKKRGKTAGMRNFFIQLALNSLWSILFFGFRAPFPAFAGIIILWIMIFLTIRSFLKVEKTAAYLLYPYLAWVSFASLLNLSIAILNP